MLGDDAEAPGEAASGATAGIAHAADRRARRGRKTTAQEDVARPNDTTNAGGVDDGPFRIASVGPLHGD